MTIIYHRKEMLLSIFKGKIFDEATTIIWVFLIVVGVTF